MRRVHIERKARCDPSAVETARRACLGQAPRWLDAAAVSARTGLPVDVAEASLLELSARFPSRIDISEAGQLRFRFHDLRVSRQPGPFRRGLGVLRRVLDALRDPILATFTLCLLPFVALVVTGGSVAGVVTIINAPSPLHILLSPYSLLAALVGFGWASSAIVLVSVAAIGLSGFLLMIAGFVMIGGLVVEYDSGKIKPDDLLLVFVVGGPVTVAMFWYGYRLAREVVISWKEVAIGSKAAWAHKLWGHVGGLLFGPRRPPPDPLADERRLTGLIVARRGVLTAGDLVGLFGWTLAEADSEIVRIMLDYGGDVAVTDDGAIVYLFGALRGAPPPGPPPEPVWETPRAAPPVFFGTTSGVIIFTAITVLPAAIGTLLGGFHGLAMLPGEGQLFGDPGHTDPDAVWHEMDPFWGPLAQGFGLWPYLAIAAVLLLRAPLFIARKVRHGRWTRSLPLLKAAAESPGGAWISEEDLDLALLARLDGDVDVEAGDVSPDGEYGRRVVFPGLELARREAEALRGPAPAPPQSAGTHT